MVVKSVVGEESQLRSAEERLSQSAIPAQIGLVIGKLYHTGVDRGFVYGVVPTPPTDAGLPACVVPDPGVGGAADRKKKGSSSKGPSGTAAPPPPPLVIDTEWVAEHARQVSRMLLGGMQVVGIYVWASEVSFKSSTPLLCQTVKAVAQAAAGHEIGPEERLVIHISFSPRRWTCRNCIVTSSSTTSDLRPCDFKMGKLLPSLQYFKCTYNFTIRLPIYNEATDSNTFKDALHIGISHLAKELRSAKCIIDGNLATDDLQCTSEGPHEVEMLLPFMSDLSLEASRLDKVVGLVTFTGAICACSYLAFKVPIFQVISDIKNDIVTSLQSRLDIICEESEGLSAGAGEEEITDMSVKKRDCQLSFNELRERCSLVFPKRVLIPWLPGVFICDYLKNSETFEDLKDHCKEMMSMEAPADINTILEVEKEAIANIGKSFWSLHPGDAASADSCPDKYANCLKETKGNVISKGCNLNILIAIAIALVSFLIGWCTINLAYRS